MMLYLIALLFKQYVTMYFLLISLFAICVLGEDRSAFDGLFEFVTVNNLAFASETFRFLYSHPLLILTKSSKSKN